MTALEPRTQQPAPIPTPAPVSTSVVAPANCLPKGEMAHRHAVERLLASYRAIPAGSTVRLAKRTSNLFRPRVAAAGPGLDVSGLGGVIAIDVDPRTGTATADVQGMCTYENLVAATLPKGFMPSVVPQLKTITLGGAVTGLGIEATSFRHGLPHESVLELDVLTGAGELLTVTPGGPHTDLFTGFPNSYGTLGYSVRLRIALEQVHPYVALRNVRFGSLDDLAEAITRICDQRSWEGTPVDFLDGVVFDAGESYLVLGSWADEVPAASDYTGPDPYYRSLRDRGHDALTVHDYLWRWDTDWFWCSRAFGAQNPWVRRIWPASRRRSDVYHRLVGLENRYQVAARIDRWRGLPARERVVQDVEIPVERTADFLRWFLDHVQMAPVWLCPLRIRQEGGSLGSVPAGARPWTLYPLRAGETYVNVGFWGTVPIAAGRADGDVNRNVEQAVAGFGGHKSLYSDAYYGREEFDRLYGGEAYAQLRRRYDPQGRLLDLYTKTVGRR
ncbi:MAG TPA: FAD-binding oxidoreductase [Kineosporiaceae bacterium]|nr:FAD-binding oxidoreductase [Kineosporiaceae bacterium]